MSMLDDDGRQPEDDVNPDKEPENIAPNPMASKIDELNYLTRWIENSKFIGSPGRAGYNYYEETHSDLTDAATIDDEVEIGTVGSNGAGLLIGWIIHTLSVRYKLYPGRKALNPLYRNFKTLANVGATIGTLIANFLPFSDNARKFFSAIITDIACIALGIFAIPYWLIRQYVFKIDSKKNDTYALTGIEGWSKYGKTLLVFGSSLGQIAGALYAYLKQSSLASASAKTSIAIYGGIVGVGSFVLGLILIPLINRISKRLGHGKILSTDEENKDVFRNNYVRSGMTLGVALGTVIGFAIGSALLPGVGSLIGATIGGAIGCIILGTALGITGNRVSQYTKRKWNVATDTENSWDYATRTTSFAFASVGALIGFFLPVPGGMAAGALLGSAIGGTLGWFAGFPIIRKARQIQSQEEASTSLSWTQRVATGVNLGTIIGAIAGLVIGLAGGPLGIIAGVTLCSAIGGIVGGLIATYYGKEARKVMKTGMGIKTKETPPTPPPAPASTLTISNALTSATHIASAPISAPIIEEAKPPATPRSSTVASSVPPPDDSKSILRNNSSPSFFNNCPALDNEPPAPNNPNNNVTSLPRAATV